MEAYRNSIEVLKRNIFIPVPIILANVAVGFAFVFLIVLAVVSGIAVGIGKERGALPELTVVALPLILLLLLLLFTVIFLKFCGQAIAVAMTLNTLKGREGTAGSIDEGIAIVRKNLKSLAALSLLLPLVVALGFIALVLPGILLWLLLWFTIVALMVEQRGAIAAMKASISFVKSRPVASLIFVLIAVLIGMLAGIVVSLLLAIPVLGAIFGTLVSPIVEGVASAFITVAATLFYTEEAHQPEG